MAFIPYVWDVNDTNTAPLPAPLLSDGYAPSAIPTSTEFNELWRNVSGLASMINALFRPATIIATYDSRPMLGWLLLEDGSIGSVTSGATLLADSSAEPLYIALWDLILDANAPVAGGRGASAASDFAANKSLTLPPSDGRALVNGAGLYIVGSVFGSSEVSITKAQTPAHTHNLEFLARQVNGGTQFPSVADTGGNIRTGDGGDDGLLGLPHNNLQPSVSVAYFIKL
jgi:hypothetical protein